MAREKQSQRKDRVRQLEKLIAAGKEKGRLTYEEVNDILPENIVSSEEIDEILTLLGNENIEIIAQETKPELEKVQPEIDETVAKTKQQDVLPRLARMDDPVDRKSVV